MSLPFFWLLSSSLKEPARIWLFPPQWIPSPVRWENYSEALTAAPFHLYLFNTLIIVLANEVGILLTASMAGYSFARLRFRGRELVFTILLATIMLPWAVTLIPRYIMFKSLGWLDTFLPLIVPEWFGGGAFNIFLLRQFFRTIPRDFTDAARIDGAGEFGIYWRIVLPLIKPALTVVAIFTFLNNWNDFMGPLIYLTSPKNFTISLGLAAFKGLYTTQWHYLMAASTATILPVLVLFFVAQRYFIQGIVLSGIKG
ncbi:MAG: sugar ABC transporter ATP-binding protein [Chloroflexi bacterium]|nr:MAG: sugar ABC transporter ATP-binding protein [Chloroflexota bacterium]